MNSRVVEAGSRIAAQNYDEECYLHTHMSHLKLLAEQSVVVTGTQKSDNLHTVSNFKLCLPSSLLVTYRDSNKTCYALTVEHNQKQYQDLID